MTTPELAQAVVVDVRAPQQQRRATDAPDGPPDAAPYQRAEAAARTRRARYALVAADVAAAVAALVIVTLLAGETPAPWALALAPLVVPAAKLGALYDRDEVVLHRSTLNEVPQLARLALLTAVVLWLAQPDLGRAALPELVVVLFAAVVAARAVARRAVARRSAQERCLLVGDPAMVERVAGKLDRRNAVLAGFLPLHERRRPLDRDTPQDTAHVLADCVRRCGAHRVIVAPGPHDDSDATVRIVSRAKALGVQVSILPRLFEVVGSSVEFDHLDGLVMLGVHRFGLSRSSWRIKRATDIAMASVALLVAAPVMALAAVAIRLETPGPILFRQPRVGRGGGTFPMLKFRSMVDGADAARAQLAGADGDLFKLADDPRVTRVGRVLRRFSLDELPQLLNVLRGEMSIVGPRPLVVDEDRRIEGWHRRRLELTPGMTGPWQVLGDSEHRVPLRDMVTIDYLYAANWSLWTDVKVLVWTVAHVLGGRGV